jgi:hypothetical protein
VVVVLSIGVRLDDLRGLVVRIFGMFGEDEDETSWMEMWLRIVKGRLKLVVGDRLCWYVMMKMGNQSLEKRGGS